MLRTELLNMRDLQRWRNNPQIHCDAAVDAIFDLVIRHADSWKPFCRRSSRDWLDCRTT